MSAYGPPPTGPADSPVPDGAPRGRWRLVAQALLLLALILLLWLILASCGVAYPGTKTGPTVTTTAVSVTTAPGAVTTVPGPATTVPGPTVTVTTTASAPTTQPTGPTSPTGPVTPSGAPQAGGGSTSVGPDLPLAGAGALLLMAALAAFATAARRLPGRASRRR